jgi:two-component system response regulator HydG
VAAGGFVTVAVIAPPDEPLEELAPSLLESLGEPAIVVDGERRIVAANRSYRNLFAHGGPACGRRCYEASHRYSAPCDELGESCPLASALASGEPARALHVHHTAEGERHESVAVYPLRDPEGRRRLFLEILTPARFASTQATRETHLVGNSPAFAAMLELVSRVAPTATTVLLLGESGTGKDLVARAVHQLSLRSTRAFVPLDCSGLSETLFESELFGHERGSFTGAHERKRGLVEAAHGGTLFLDEVGDIPVALQVKLLRLIETGVFRRVGSVAELHADFRLVCATHRDLAQMVKDGKFREDLYYRISAFPIELPPLRERIADLPLLAESIFQRLGCGGGYHLEPGALEVLRRHSFPGNVRELHNILERACLLADDGAIGAEHLPSDCGAAETAPAGQMPFDSRQVVSLDALEARYIRWLAGRFDGNRSDLATLLGISERTLYRRLKQ